MTIQQQTLMAFGGGYSVMALAPRLLSQGWRVIGTRRSVEGVSELAATGVEGHLIGEGAADFDPPEGAHWLISVPPDDEGCPVFRAFQEHAGRAASVTYLSTTGVYGDLGGGWAFEWTPVNPQSKRARRRVEAETQWRGVRADVRLVRLPGIYGPGRSPLDRVAAGEAQRIIKPGQVFSRIHVDDLASGLQALLAAPDAAGVFHFCDDAPAPPQDVTAYAAELMGAPPPPEIAFAEADLSPMARSFYSECKRVSNGRAKARLCWRPVYPSYREGLSQIAAGQA